MDRPTTADRSDGRAMPLGQRLALLTTSIIVFVLVLTLAIAYYALAGSSVVETSQRLSGAVQLVAALGTQNVTPRLDSLRRAADNDSVRAVFTATDAARAGTAAVVPADANAKAALVLSRLRPTVVGALPDVELWTVGGRRILAVSGDTLHRAPVDGTTLLPLKLPGLGNVQPADSVMFGSFYFEAPDSAYYWNIAPVRDAGRLVGYVAHRIRLQSTDATLQRVRRLAGNGVQLLVVSNDRRNWVRVSNGRTEPVSVPRVARESVGVGQWYDAPGGRTLGAEAQVRASGFSMLLETPEREVRAPVRGLLAVIAGIGVLVAIIGAMLAYLAGGRIARPIGLLTDAAEELAAGRGTGRVAVKGEDEIGRLAASFNAMVTQVDTARRALQQRFEETRATANQLELSNVQLQRAMREADHAREEAQNANRAKSDFLAVMSHELRTPLNAIGGYTQLIELGIHGPITDAQRDALGRITRSQSHLLHLINDVLIFARVDAGRIEYTMADVPLDTMLSGVETLVAPQLHAKRLTFAYDRCDAELTAHADQDKLTQILLNLLTNAIKFTPEGGRIAVRCETEGDTIQIHVSDSGVGIPAERLDAIFDPFVQLDRVMPGAAADGVGLGLAISRDLARGMGGDLSVQSTVGDGSTFTVTLGGSRLAPVAGA